MAPQSDDMDRQIGILIGKMDVVQETLRRQEEKSDASRNSMQRSIETISDRVSNVEARVSSIHEDVQEMKPVVDDVRIWRQRGIGALAIVGIAASALTFLLTTYFTNIIAWLNRP